jgi:putative ABC transport system permease protein
MAGGSLFLSLAIRNLQMHWLRSLLAAIGIIIGVMAISSMGILGNAFSLSITNSLSSVGDSIIVTPHVGYQGGMSSVSTSERLSDRQIELIRRASANSKVFPIYAGGDRIKVQRDTLYASVYGIDPKDLPSLLDIEKGQYLRGASGVMIGSKLAKDNNLTVGSRILIGEEESGVRVVGIIKERGMGFDINPDNSIISSDLWYRDFYETKGYDQAIIKATDIKEIEQIKSSIEKQLNKRVTEVDVYDTRMILNSITETFGQITLFTMAIGGISLIVAGVSIFNVMMMSVMERYKEIGIIRSIGTKRAEVRSMFIYEALILGLSGSVVGGIFSFAAGYLVVAVLMKDVSYLYNPASLIQIPYGMTFGIVTSMLSGLYPAWKASSLNPIDALRHE